MTADDAATRLLLNKEQTIEYHIGFLANFIQKKCWFLSTAESCTGGMVAAACTELAGSSNWFDRGFVTYSNAAKTELLGVSAKLIEQHGAVSEPVASAMVQGALQHAMDRVAVAITGIAGPGGGSIDKPVGTVCFGFAIPAGVNSQITTETCHFEGDRAQVRQASVLHAVKRLNLLLIDSR